MNKNSIKNLTFLLSLIAMINPLGAQAASFQQTLRSDLIQLRNFRKIAKSGLSDAEKTNNLKNLIAWAKTELDHQTPSSYDPINLYFSWRLAEVEDLVNHKKFDAANQYLNDHVSEVISKF